ncbi:MAG: aminoglycoside phosphotransferase family protein [Spirulinaceae cyanobacterium]
MKKSKNLVNIIKIANQFSTKGKVKGIQAWGSGNVNDTFLVTLDIPEENFILQRINIKVFRQPKLVMQNLRICTEYISQHLQSNHLKLERRWEVPKVQLTQNSQDSYVDSEGNFWRGLSFIQGESFDTIKNTNLAQEVGYALGRFHDFLSDLPTENLADTLPGFHITPLYLQQYEQVLEKVKIPASAEVKYGLRFISDRQKSINVLETAKQQKKLPLRPIHGDPKVNNVIFDRTKQQAISIIDLDTVKPGLVHYDIGDCLRSGCNPSGEETQSWQEVRFEIDICQAILQGYFTLAKGFLNDNDYEYIYEAIRLITFELGLRFFSDYLAGDIYFKAKYPEHNLARALVQFKLTESIESQADAIQSIIKDLK